MTARVPSRDPEILLGRARKGDHEAFRELDRLLSGGGQLPLAWQVRGPRSWTPPRTEDIALPPGGDDDAADIARKVMRDGVMKIKPGTKYEHCEKA